MTPRALVSPRAAGEEEQEPFLLWAAALKPSEAAGVLRSFCLELGVGEAKLNPKR